MDLHRLLGGYGFFRLQHFGDGAALLQRRERAGSQACCPLVQRLFFLGSFIWFIPPMVVRIVYPDLHVIWPHLSNPNEASYVAASLTFLPHGLIGVMLAAMFSATMANLSANFNLKSAILSKDIYQTLFRPHAGERELLITGAIMTTLVGGVTIALAVMMASRGESIFAVMMSLIR